MNVLQTGVIDRGFHVGAFGDWVKEKRGERKVTLKELEALTGVSYGAISDWERGRRTPHRNTVAKVAQALGADPQEALRALMADTPGLEDEVEHVPDDEYLQSQVLGYTGDNPILKAAATTARAVMEGITAQDVAESMEEAEEVPEGERFSTSKITRRR